MLFERIQNSRRAAVLVARVKRQIDGLSARVTDVKRVVLPQFLGGDIADRPVRVIVINIAVPSLALPYAPAWTV